MLAAMPQVAHACAQLASIFNVAYPLRVVRAKDEVHHKYRITKRQTTYHTYFLHLWAILCGQVT